MIRTFTTHAQHTHVHTNYDWKLNDLIQREIEAHEILFTLILLFDLVSLASHSRSFRLNNFRTEFLPSNEELFTCMTTTEPKWKSRFRKRLHEFVFFHKYLSYGSCLVFIELLDDNRGFSTILFALQIHFVRVKMFIYTKDGNIWIKKYFGEIKSVLFLLIFSFNFN